MRTNVEIDDTLLAEAQELAGTRTKKATVELALAELIRRRKVKGLLAYRDDRPRHRPRHLARRPDRLVIVDRGAAAGAVRMLRPR